MQNANSHVQVLDPPFHNRYAAKVFEDKVFANLAFNDNWSKRKATEFKLIFCRIVVVGLWLGESINCTARKKHNNADVENYNLLLFLYFFITQNIRMGREGAIQG